MSLSHQTKQLSMTISFFFSIGRLQIKPAVRCRQMRRMSAWPYFDSIVVRDQFPAKASFDCWESVEECTVTVGSMTRMLRMQSVTFCIVQV